MIVANNKDSPNTKVPIAIAVNTFFDTIYGLASYTYRQG